MFSTPTLHHYMESCMIIRHYAILSGIVMGKQAVFTKTQAVNIIYIIRKNFKQISLIYWNVFNFFAAIKIKYLYIVFYHAYSSTNHFLFRVIRIVFSRITFRQLELYRFL